MSEEKATVGKIASFGDMDREFMEPRVVGEEAGVEPEGDEQLDPQSALLDKIDQLEQRIQALQAATLPIQQTTAPRSYEPVPEPTADDLSAMILNFRNDPVGVVRQALEYNLGMPLDYAKEGLQKAWQTDERIYGNEVAANFMQRHLKHDEFGNLIDGDYFPCPENAQVLQKHREARGLPLTVESLEIAFAELKAANLLKPIPEGLFGDGDEEVTKPSPSALSGTGSSRDPRSRSAGMTDQELRKKLESMPFEELKKTVYGG
jgi:hypothetical protein